jgi:hypothetical protein
VPRFPPRSFGHRYHMTTFEMFFFGLTLVMFLLIGLGLLSRSRT